jgi:hypothetical protein
MAKMGGGGVGETLSLSLPTFFPAKFFVDTFIMTTLPVFSSPISFMELQFTKSSLAVINQSISTSIKYFNRLFV